MITTVYTVLERDIKALLREGNNSNANMAHNPETIHKYVADNIMEQALYNYLPTEYVKAHNRGDLHIHDREYFLDRSMNCLVHDPRYFIKYGLKVDGNGDHTSISGPPMHYSTMINHVGEMLLAGQSEMSGGQGVALLNCFLAPFVEDMPYNEIKQGIQSLVYNLNMAYASRGGQVPFTTVMLEFGIPKFLRDYPAYGPGGEIKGTYGDWYTEANLVQSAFCEVLLEGDYHRKMHLFPNTIWSLRPEYDIDEHELDKEKVHELSAKFGTSYFINMYPKYQGTHATYMGCRTRLSDNWTGDWEKDCLRTGNASYITVNLPRLGLICNSEDEVIDVLRTRLEQAHDIMLLRRDIAQKNMNNGIFPFLLQKNGEKESYYNWENTTNSFGFVGLNELCLKVTGEELGHTNADRFGLRILEEINKVKEEYLMEGLRWSVIATPAESTAYRFASIDKTKYGDKSVYKGTQNNPYYTNSCHIPVDTNLSLPEKIKWEEKTHPLTQGGHIFHAFMGESYSDPESLMSLTGKICKTNIGFWAYSSAMSYCMKCHTVMRGLQSKCTHCGETKEVEWYDRITGYVQQVGHAEHSQGGWNNGKKQELLDRKRW